MASSTEEGETRSLLTCSRVRRRLQATKYCTICVVPMMSAAKSVTITGVWVMQHPDVTCFLWRITRLAKTRHFALVSLISKLCPQHATCKESRQRYNCVLFEIALVCFLRTRMASLPPNHKNYPH